MADLDIYLDIDRQIAVMGPLNSSRRDLPKCVQGDTLFLRLHLLKGFSNVMTEYERVPTAGITLEAVIGAYPAVGNEDDPEYLTQQFTWTPSEDESEPYFSGTLSLNTEEITDLLGTAASAFASLHIRRTETGYPHTILLERITILSSPLKEGGFTANVEPTPLSVEVANALYVKAAGHQSIIRLISPDGTKQADLYYGDDGALHVDAIT